VGLVAEMRSGLKQLLHGNVVGRHGIFSFRLTLCGAAKLVSVNACQPPV
jgi:hypothetical protein